MIEIFSTIFTGVLGGGATGLLGILLQRWFDHKKQRTDLELAKLQIEAAQETRRIELEAQERMAAKAAELQTLQSVLDAQAREAEAAERSYQASIESDRATYSAPAAQEKSRFVRYLMATVDGVRGLMRPSITTYTLYMLTAVFLWVRMLYETTGVTMTNDQVFQLAMQAVGTVFYLATTTTVWWFGVRPAQPPQKR
jgi:hypothetical protein